ncbi:hypothetical protein ACJX0J_028863 [Zea mays]
MRAPSVYIALPLQLVSLWHVRLEVVDPGLDFLFFGTSAKGISTKARTQESNKTLSGDRSLSLALLCEGLWILSIANIDNTCIFAASLLQDTTMPNQLYGRFIRWRNMYSHGAHQDLKGKAFIGVNRLKGLDKLLLNLIESISIKTNRDIWSHLLGP